MIVRRRSVLAGLGFGAGAAVLSPLIRQVRAGAPATGPRFVFVIEGNGVHAGNLLSEVARTALVDAGAKIAVEDRILNRKYAHEKALVIANSRLASAPALGSLAASSDSISLEEQASVVLGLSSKVSGGGHTCNYGALSCSSSRPRLPSAATLDHILASDSGVRAQTPFDVVRLGIHAEDPLNYNTCAIGPQKPTPIVCDPTTAFLSLFGSVAGGQGSAVFQGRRALLDFINDDASRALSAFSGNSQERQKIEQYLASIEVLSARQEVISGMKESLEAVLPEGPGVSPLYESNHNLEKLDAMVELATAALIGSLTNVVVLASGTGERGYNLSYTSLGLDSPERHGICHANDHETLTRITERHVSLTARLARALAAVPEGSGTMLDHTVIVFMSDNGEKHHSKSEEWPLLVLGGSAVGMARGGSTIAYPGNGRAENRQLSNFCSSLTHLTSSPVDEFGVDPARIVAGPLAQLLTG